MRPITSIKHYVSLGPTNGSTASQKYSLIVADQMGAVSANEVLEGAHVKAIWIELWVSNNVKTDNPSFSLMIVKLPGEAPIPTAVEVANPNTYPNKKNILFYSRGILGKDQTAIPVLRQWLMIPKSKQRFGLGDELALIIHDSVGGSNGIYMCGTAIYKAYV